MIRNRLAPIYAEHHESVPERPILMEPELPPGDDAATLPVEGQGVRGEVGVRLDDAHGELLLIVDGHLLEKSHVTAPIPGLVAALEGEFARGENQYGVSFAEPLVRGFAEVALRLPAMFDALAQVCSQRDDDASDVVPSAIRHRLVEHLDLALVTGNSMAKWLGWVGCPAPVALRLIESAELSPPLTVFLRARSALEDPQTSSSSGNVGVAVHPGQCRTSWSRWEEMEPVPKSCAKACGF